MRVLHINSLRNGTGTATASVRLNNGMNKYGFKSKLITLEDGFHDFKINFKSIYARFKTIKTRRDEAAKNKYTSTTISKTSGQISLDFYSKEIEESDIIILHWVYGGYIDLNTLKLIKKPVVLFMHDMWYFTGGCFIAGDCLKYKGGCINCDVGYDGKIIIKNIEEKKEIYKNELIHFVAPSKYHKNKAEQSYLLKNKLIKVSYNYLDLDYFKPLNSNKTNKLKILFSAHGGGDNPYKGFKDFNKCIVELERMNVVFEINLVGWSYNNELGNISSKVNSFGLVKSDRKMIEIYNDSTLLIFPSKDESFGQVVVEAMACGVPVVAYPVGIVSEILTEENGYMTKEKTIEELCSGVLKIIKNQKYYSRKSREKIVEIMRPELIFGIYEDIKEMQIKNF